MAAEQGKYTEIPLDSYSESARLKHALIDKVLMGAIRVYQMTLSRQLPPSCRFFPSCSEYTLQAIGKYGVMVKSPTGFPIQSPYVSIANRQAEIMMRISSEFGFTPASRGRISVGSDRGPDLFDEVDKTTEK